tara:strand:+ start:2375 stop:3301 length:927 start_codon:yes stop_codon:yes gene_type:complete
MSLATIYSINPTDKKDDLSVAIRAKEEMAASYTSVTTIKAKGNQYLLGYQATTGTTDTYLLSAKSPFLSKVEKTLVFGKDWDKIEPFYMANKPHIMCYQSKNGHMYFYPITDDLKTEHPLHFYHTRTPLTTDLTEVKPLVSQGQVFVLGYNHLNGFVNIWTVSATSTSTGNQPPLAVDVEWAHQWAKGWTRFAFFTWGNENYFLKTNDWKPNVNIDHIWDDLSKGTNEVGSHLTLKDDQDLNIVHPFYVGPGDPYFLTYLEKTGESTFNRIHGDCMGWTTCATETGVPKTTQIIPYRIGESNFAIYLS